MRTVAAVTTIRVVSRKTSKAFSPKAQPTTQITRPTVSVTRTLTASRGAG